MQTVTLFYYKTLSEELASKGMTREIYSQMFSWHGTWAQKKVYKARNL